VIAPATKCLIIWCPVSARSISGATVKTREGLSYVDPSLDAICSSVEKALLATTDDESFSKSAFVSLLMEVSAFRRSFQLKLRRSSR
jgi:hypothetical protein